MSLSALAIFKTSSLMRLTSMSGASSADAVAVNAKAEADMATAINLVNIFMIYRSIDKVKQAPDKARAFAIQTGGGKPTSWHSPDFQVKQAHLRAIRPSICPQYGQIERFTAWSHLRCSAHDP